MNQYMIRKRPLKIRSYHHIKTIDDGGNMKIEEFIVKQLDESKKLFDEWLSVEIESEKKEESVFK